MFRTGDLLDKRLCTLPLEDVVKAASTIPVSAATTTTTIITNDEIILARALAELKSAKLPTIIVATTITAVSTRPRAKGLVIHEQEQASTPTVSSQQPSQLNVQDKDNVQAMIDVDYQMAQQMQAKEQENLSIEEKSKLFVQLLEARKKHFVAMRAPEKWNKPPTKA
ncbi:hypothetical protein Tco_0734449 [Tanacetum coccineum]